MKVVEKGPTLRVESAGQTRDGFARGPRRLVIVLHTTLSNGSAHFSVMDHRGI